MRRALGRFLLLVLAAAAAFGVARAQQPAVQQPPVQQRPAQQPPTQPGAAPAGGGAAAQPAGVILGLDGKPDPLPDAAFGATVKQQCSKCHVVPLPQYLPRGMWRLRIQEMAQRSLMGTGVTPGEESVLWQMDTSQFVRYFEARSPVTLPLPDPWPPGDGGLKFTHQLMNPPDQGRVPVIANTRFLDLDGDGIPEVVACDMGHGIVYLGEPLKKPGELREIARIPNPDHAAMVDFDGDGKQDLLIADLGDFMPGDHEKGSVVLLRQTDHLQFEKIVLVDHLARTADVEAADFNGDGKLDVVCAAFLPNAEHPAFQLLERQGNLAPFTSIGWLEQTQKGVFVPHPLETGKLTHTTLDVGDFDGDGDIDIVTGNFVGFTFTKSDTGFKADTTVDLWVNQAKQPAAAAAVR